MAETNYISSPWATFLSNVQQGTSETSNNQQVISTQQIGKNSSTSQATGQTVKAISSVAGKFGQTGSSFGMGMQVGYQAVSDTTGPLLAYQAARYQKKILGMKQDLAEISATQSQTAAEDCIRAGHNQVAAITHQAGQVKASTRVKQASSGIRVSGSGSAAENLTSQDISRDMQVNQTLANAVISSFGYRRQAVNAKCNALALEAEKKSINPWATLICSVASNVTNGMKAGGAYQGIASMFSGCGSGSSSGGSGSNVMGFGGSDLGVASADDYGGSY